MSILSGLSGRSGGLSLENPNVPITADSLAAILGLGARTSAGVNVNQDNALRLVVVLACIRLIAETIATLPLGTFVKERDAKTGRDRRKQVDEPPWLDQPNLEGLTKVELIESWLCSMLSDGNSYTQLILDRRSVITEVFPLPPTAVYPQRTSAGITYDSSLATGRNGKTMTAADCLHIRAFRKPGAVKGISPIEYARQAIGLGLATEQFGAAFFGNGTHAEGVIETPEKLTLTQARLILNTWRQEHSGLQNAHQPGILSEGATWKQISIAPNEAQFLETRRFQVNELCRLYRVPPHMVADVERSTSWGTGIEEQGIGFVIYTLRTWIVRIEAALKPLLPPGQFARFNVAALLRGSTKERYDAYAVGRQWGWMTINDILTLEDSEPVDDGNERLVPLNMTRAGDDVSRALFWRAQAVNFLVTAGFDPKSALEMVGLDPNALELKPPPLADDPNDPSGDPANL